MGRKAGMNNSATIFGSWMKALEFLQVVNGTKLCMRTALSDEEIPRISALCQQYSLYIEFAQFKVKIMDSEQKFSHKGITIPKDQEGLTFSYIAQEEKIAALAKLYEQRNDSKNLGKILGYPRCCIQFFCEHEEEKAKSDFDFTSLCMKRGIKYWELNISKRDQDISLISHFPCSMDCKESLLHAQKNYLLFQSVYREYAEVWQEPLRQV